MMEIMVMMKLVMWHDYNIRRVCTLVEEKYRDNEI